MNNFFKQFGGRVTPALRRRYEQSENWRAGSFQNLETTDLTISLRDFPRVIYKQLTDRASRVPQNDLPVKPFDRQAFLAPADKAKFIWYGHSVVLLRMEGQTLLIDPMLGPDTTPIAPLPTKRFSANTLALIDDFPNIDLLLMTHDHYDHLDYQSIQKLKGKTKRYFVALGVKRHLVRWGVAPDLITEFDWWESQSLGNIEVSFTPTRHFSGRGLTDRAKTLWGGWVFKTIQEKLWFSGDGGYGTHFKTIGERLGPFDFAFMECGQYNDDWRPVHLFPDEAVRAAQEAGVQKAMPVHWAGFPLSYQHTWQEPAEDFVRFAQEQQLDFLLPRLGELCSAASILQEKWWT